MITQKTEEEIKIMAEGGRILAQVMSEIEKMAKPGIATIELDRAAEALILSRGAEPAFKGYDNFPYSLCVSVNETIVHGLPSDYMLKDGDVVGIDLGVLYKGYNADMAVTVGIGKISFEAARLIKDTKEALKRGIKAAQEGSTFGDIGRAVQKFSEGRGYGVIRELCGHGIGRELHEDPKIPNIAHGRVSPEIRQGMTFCIEPMLSLGDYRLKKAKDGYGYATKDGSLSAHFEHTLAVTSSGPSILTKI